MRPICLCLFLVSGYWLLHKVVLWIGRIRTFKKTMPVVLSLLPPNSIFRFFWPKKWQTFHQDWHMQYGRTIYRKLGSDIFALVCLFEYDYVYFCDPLANMGISVTQPNQFPRDTYLAAKVLPYISTMLRVDCRLWPKCSYINWRSMEVLSEGYFTYIFPEEPAARSC